MKEQFLKRLAVLAEICRHKLDPWQMELYDRELQSRGYQRMTAAIDRLMVTRKSNERFPSIAELKELVPRGNPLRIAAPVCGECYDGLVFAVPRNNPNVSQYVFRCDCQGGQMRQENFPTWRGQSDFVAQ